MGLPKFCIAYAIFQLETTKRRVDHLLISFPLDTYSIAKLLFLVHFTLTPYLTPCFKGSNWVMPIFHITYAIVKLQTFPTGHRSYFYLIPSRQLFNRKITFIASGRRDRGCCGQIALALCK